MSPRFPPTPEQKKVTPREWLSEGLYDGEVLSLDEVRRSLVKDIEAAEEIDEVHFDSYHKSELIQWLTRADSRLWDAVYYSSLLDGLQVFIHCCFS